MKCSNNTLAGILFCHTALLSDAYAQGNSESRLNLLDLGLEELMQIQIINPTSNALHIQDQLDQKGAEQLGLPVKPLP